jgi:hypothetical protein
VDSLLPKAKSLNVPVKPLTTTAVSVEQMTLHIFNRAIVVSAVKMFEHFKHDFLLKRLNIKNIN